MSDSESSKGSNGAVIVIVILVIILAGGAGYYFFKYKPDQEAKEKARQEQLAKAAAEKQEKERKAKEAEQRKARYEELVMTADSDFDSENWESALTLYREASQILPNESHPKNRIAILEEKLAAPKVGTIEMISSATGRSYVIVSSSLDGDLAMDYANKLSSEGTSTKVIEPYGNNKFYRVSVANYESYDQAVAAAPSMSTAESREVWVLKY